MSELAKNVIDRLDKLIEKEAGNIAYAKSVNDVEDYYYAKGLHRGLRISKRQILEELKEGV